MRGEPRAVIVSGEPGIGKSRLLQEALLGAGKLGAAVGLGRGYEDLSIPYMPVLELLRSLLDDYGRGALAPESSPLAPFEGRARSALKGADEEAGRARLFLEVSNRLIGLAGRRPLVLAIDDLHWLDQSSLALLSHLVFAVSDARTRRAVPIMLLLTIRPVDESSIAARMRARLQRETFTEVIDLEGLDAYAARRLITAEGVRHPSSQLVSRVLETTGGNPLFIEAVVRELVQSDAIDFVGGDAVTRVDPSELRLSTDVTSATASRVDGIDAQTRELLEFAAVIGQCFAPDLLSAVTGVPAPDLRRHLIGGSDGLVRTAGEHMEFGHPLMRHVLCNRIPRGARQRMHDRIAQELMKTGSAQGGPEDWEVVRHLMAAGSSASPESFLEYGRRAGDWAAGLCAWREAGEAYAAAADSALPAEQRAPLHFKAARCFMKNYDHGLRSEHYRLALHDYQAMTDPKGIAQVVAESARSDLYDLPLGELRDMEPFEKALDGLDEDASGLRGPLLARMADAHFYARNPGRGVQFARLARECGEHVGDHDLCADACISEGLALHQAMQYEQSAESYRTGLSHVESSGDDWLECALRVRYAGVLMSVARLDECRDELERAIAAAHRLNDAGEEAFALAYRAGLEASRGDFAAVEESVQASLRLHTRLEWRPWAPMLAVPALAYTRFLRGDWDRADDALASLDEPGRLLEQVGRAVHGMVLIYRALIRCMAPTTGADVDPLAALVDRYSKRIVPSRADGSALGVVCALVELADQRGMAAAVTGPVEVLEKAFESGAMLCNGWPSLIPRVLGVAAFARGELDQAERLFEAALRATERMEIPPERARAQFDYARMLVAEGGAQPEARARDLLQNACETFARLGMKPFWARADSLAQSLGMHVPELVEPPDGLHAQDVDLLRRLSAGHDDQRVASDLLLRRETVRDQVAELLGRLGLNGRKEAVGYAAQRGLLQPPDGGLPVTLVVTDLEGFTPMVEQLGDKEGRRVMQLHNRMLRSVIQDYNGLEVTHTGDGIISSFRSTIEALGGAVAIQRRFDEYNGRGIGTPLHLRIGLHRGSPLPDDGRLFGVAVNAAVRICMRCPPGRILASDLVHAEARDWKPRFKRQGTTPLKGVHADIDLFEVEWQTHELTTREEERP